MSDSAIINAANTSEEDPWADFEISDLLNDSEDLLDTAAPAAKADLTNGVGGGVGYTSLFDDLISSLLEPTEKAPQKPKLRRVRKERHREFPSSARKRYRIEPDRTPFRHEKYFDSYTSFLHYIRDHWTTLPDKNCSRIDLKAFPKKYRSPTEVPRRTQKKISHARFFYVRGLVYRPKYGHALYIVPRRSAEQGRILQEFRRYSGRREVFHRNPMTGAINYLGEFRLVKSPAFPYTRNECGSFPELSEAYAPPLGGNLEPCTVFFVLQFMRYNYKVVDEFVTA